MAITHYLQMFDDTKGQLSVIIVIVNFIDIALLQHWNNCTVFVCIMSNNVSTN